MQANFFQWIREGVKQSVLLGVSDAVNQMGTIPHSEELNQQLRSALSFDGELRTTTARMTPGDTSSTSRKRLGRSLKDG